MNDPPTTLHEVARYLNALRGEESVRSVAKRANISHSRAGDLLAERELPSVDMVLAIGEALGARPILLLQKMGLLEVGAGGIADPHVAHLARQAEVLPPAERDALLRVWHSALDAIRVASGRGSLSPQDQLIHDVHDEAESALDVDALIDEGRSVSDESNDAPRRSASGGA